LANEHSLGGELLDAVVSVLCNVPLTSVSEGR
jgi:hypothetical protein